MRKIAKYESLWSLSEQTRSCFYLESHDEPDHHDEPDGHDEPDHHDEPDRHDEPDYRDETDVLGDYICEVCDKTFDKKYYLSRHMIR